MLDELRQALSEGWRELSQRAGGALTRFKPGAATGGDSSSQDELPPMSGWAYMAADVFDDDDRIVVRLEAPGMRREDFNIELHDNVLSVWGEKRFERESGRGRYRMLQCAYGSFHRDIVLPVTVKAEQTRAIYRDGVLRVELPKSEHAKARRVDVT